MTSYHSYGKIGSLTVSREQFTYMTTSLKGYDDGLDIPIVLYRNRDAQNTSRIWTVKRKIKLEEVPMRYVHQTDEATWNNTPTEIIIRKQRNGERDRKN